jgi:hypothetical protein
MKLSHESDPVFSPEAAGRYLGGDDNPISPKTLANWRIAGTGPEFEDVGRIRYRKSALDAWRATRRRRSTSDAPQAA